MKSIISKTMALVVIGTTIFSFSPKPGGEGFEIYLNNKVLIQQYGNDMNNVKSLQLNKSASTDKLTIRYHHCGKVGKNRIVSLRDGQNRVLKVFQYADVSTPVAAMSVKVKEILILKKGTLNSLKLYYSSSELPKGRMLAIINMENANMTRL